MTSVIVAGLLGCFLATLWKRFRECPLRVTGGPGRVQGRELRPCPRAALRQRSAVCRSRLADASSGSTRVQQLRGQREACSLTLGGQIATRQF